MDEAGAGNHARIDWIISWLTDFEVGDSRLDSVAQLRFMLSEAYDEVGPDHPVAMSLANHLAGAYLDQGDLRLATAMYERTLRSRDRVLGCAHPDTLISGNNLAVAYRAAGALPQAIDLFRQTFMTAERVLGISNEYTLSIGSNLADTLLKAGQSDQAGVLYEQMLVGARQFLGPRGPFTSATRGPLGRARSCRPSLIPAQRRPND